MEAAVVLAKAKLSAKDVDDVEEAEMDAVEEKTTVSI
jgi:hypothetical protein